MNNEVNEKFNEFKNGSYSEQDKQTVLDNEDAILKKSSRGPLAKFFDDISTMCKMVKAWANGTYAEIPAKTITMLILTLVYVFSPIDLVPDFIPGIGLLDDAGMVTLCLAAARSDINDFRNWTKQHNAA